MLGIPSETNHNDGKVAVAPLLDATAPFACGDKVGSPDATLPYSSASQRPLLRTSSAIMMAGLLIIMWMHHPFACGLRPVVSAMTTTTEMSSVAVHRLSEVFQVYPPVLTVNPGGGLEITDGSANASVAVLPSTKPTCQETLVEHSFANSYGQPYVGAYAPPSCDFNSVTFNLSVVAAGKQFDRLGSVYFGDIELLRTSTAEPSKSGITWTYLKDMTSFLPLLRVEQKLIFDLGNLVNDVYTAPFNVTLTASFFTVDDAVAPAELIIPISKHQSSADQASVFHFPQETALNEITLPQNIRRAVLTVAATGQADEEFWWGNVLQSEIDTFPSTDVSLLGFSPFREVQVYIDGLLAGVASPFPVIFTGGIVPGLWRPVVGIDTFDLQEEELDITPWLGRLCDGQSHTFEIRVTGLNDSSDGTAYPSNTTGDNWWLSGKLFLWLDAAGHITAGSKLRHYVPEPIFSISSTVYRAFNGSNSSVAYIIDAHREVSISSDLELSDGFVTSTWSQQIRYHNRGNYTSSGDQTNIFRAVGQHEASGGYHRSFDYPLYSHSTQAMVLDNLTLTAQVNRSKNTRTLGRLVFPTGIESYALFNTSFSQPSYSGALLTTSQVGGAYYSGNQTDHTSYSYGTTEQHMILSGLLPLKQPELYTMPDTTHARQLFHRHVVAVNDSVVQDQETLMGISIGRYYLSAGDGEDMPLAGSPGRGAWARESGAEGGQS